MHLHAHKSRQHNHNTYFTYLFVWPELQKQPEFKKKSGKKNQHKKSMTANYILGHKCLMENNNISRKQFGADTGMRGKMWACWDLHKGRQRTLRQGGHCVKSTHWACSSVTKVWNYSSLTSATLDAQYIFSTHMCPHKTHTQHTVLGVVITSGKCVYGQ